MGQKVSFLAISGHFGAFLTLFEPLGTQSKFFFQKSENTIPPISKMNLYLHAKFQKILMCGSF